MPHPHARLLAMLLATLPVAALAQDDPPADPPPPSSAEQARAETREAVEAIRDYAENRRQAALDQARVATQELDRRLEPVETALEQRRTSMGEVARSRSLAVSRDLQERRLRMAEWYGSMRHASGDAWSEVRDGFVRSHRELSDAMGRARAALDVAESSPSTDATDATADPDAAPNPDADIDAEVDAKPATPPPPK